LAEDIISGVYPPGTRLDERTLADKLDASRTPIREALRQLAARGLVQFAPMRGAFVAEISLQDIADLMNAQCELEAVCARLAAESMTAMEKADLEYLLGETRKIASKGDLGDYLEANARFHKHILDGSHNPVLSRLVGDVRERLRPYREYHPAEQDRLQTAVDAHDAIVAAIMKGDGEQAYLSMRAHNTRLGSAALRALKEAHARASSPEAGHPPGPAAKSGPARAAPVAKKPLAGGSEKTSRTPRRVSRAA
jgi:DNA-binding GntR family transcriptional regulator